MSQTSSRPPSEANNRDGRDGMKFEDKLRLCRERQEDERQRRIQDIEMSIQQKHRYRQQVEDERRRKIDELKVKDLEKRTAVEERKKLIWEAEQERKEAMLRRSLDRDNKLEAKRLAQRNNTSFVFGSSTPRTLDLDLPALGCGRSQTMLFATPNRQSDENQSSRRRPVSAYYSDDFNISNSYDKPDTDTTFPLTTTADMSRDNYRYRSALYSEQARACLTMTSDSHSGHDLNVTNGSFSSATDDHLMSTSLVSLQGQTPRGRRHHTELTPAQPRERILAASTGRINRENANQRSPMMASTDPIVKAAVPKRAVSMTRLDQLAQPRRRYLDDTLKSNNSLSGSPDVPEVPEVKRRVKPTVPRKPRPFSIGSPYAVKLKVEDKVEPKNEPMPATPSAYRGSRAHDKQPHTPSTATGVHMRPNRARSAGAPQPRPLSLVSPDSDGNTKPTPPRKPAHVKAAAMARKANKANARDGDVTPTSAPDPTISVVINSNNMSSEGIVKQNSSETPVPSLDTPKPSTELPALITTDTTNGAVSDNNGPSKSKEVSEEDYKKMMAERRRLAREQAEREAEAERQRVLKEAEEAEERQRREEEEQKRLEEEQLRLIEIQRKAEEERLRKAMEENSRREEEENKRRAEEQRLRHEKEEKERRAKDEAEQQRRELEERLKRDAAERLARKNKLEAIMSRTRKAAPTPRADTSPPTHSPNETPEPPTTDSNCSTPEKNREIHKNHQNMMKNEQKSDDMMIITTSDKHSTPPDLLEGVNRAVELNNKQNNGQSSPTHNGSHNHNINNNNHIESFGVSDNLLDLSGTGSANSSIDQLIHINYSQPNTRDDLNSNSRFANGNGFTNGANGHKSQEQTAITDLLS